MRVWAQSDVLFRGGGFDLVVEDQQRGRWFKRIEAGLVTYLEGNGGAIGVLDSEHLRNLDREGPWTEKEDGRLAGGEAHRWKPTATLRTAEAEFLGVNLDGHCGGGGWGVGNWEFRLGVGTVCEGGKGHRSAEPVQ